MSGQNTSALIEGIKFFFGGLFKIVAILFSWLFVFIGIIGTKLGEMFSKLGNK